MLSSSMTSVGTDQWTMVGEKHQPLSLRGRMGQSEPVLNLSGLYPALTVQALSLLTLTLAASHTDTSISVQRASGTLL